MWPRLRRPPNVVSSAKCAANSFVRDILRIRSLKSKILGIATAQVICYQRFSGREGEGVYLADTDVWGRTLLSAKHRPEL